MNRRTLLLLLGAASATGAVGIKLNSAKIGDYTPPAVDPIDGRLPWKNWSGDLLSYPANRFAPRNEDDLKKAILSSSGEIRPVGASHSFSPLVPTNDTLISMDLMGGVKSVDTENNIAVMGAGGKLAQLSPELSKYGVAFPNLPDINKQSLAGAISTATHGTGASAPSMSAELSHMRMMTSGGDILTCSRNENADIFDAARVSLGSLGIITEVGYKVEPEFNLTRKKWVEEYSSLVGRAMDLFHDHRSFEFYCIPFTGHCIGISLDTTDLPINPPLNDVETDNEGILELQDLRNKLGWNTALRKRVGFGALAGIETEQVTDVCWKLFASERTVRFHEMEYHMPAAKGLETLDEIVQHIEKNHKEVFFPIEVRYIKGDDALISPFHGGDRISIAVHVFHEDSYDKLFKDIEPIFQKNGGRPHWGKMHNCDQNDLKAMYPQWDKFSRIRKELDPQNKFLNTHLKQVFGI